MTKIVLRIASPAKRFFKGLASHWSVYGTSLGSAFACVALIGTVGIFVLPKPGAELVRASYEEPAGTTSPDIVAQTELTQPLGSSGASEFSSFDSGDPSIWGTSSNPKFDLKPNASSCIGLATCGQPSSQVGQKTFMENSAVAAISTGNIQAIDFRDQR
ncbi:MAG TPA: hypothetical protein VEH07_05520, partial [Alphaproteobacteria bacterium]|nr:hypothetical protein [Alphaproteobacteria bacterium]